MISLFLSKEPINEVGKNKIQSLQYNICSIRMPSTCKLLWQWNNFGEYEKSKTSIIEGLLVLIIGFLVYLKGYILRN